MPVNATYEYFNAENKYHQATSPKAKLEALYEMLRTAPSHKSSESLRREITKKIAKVKLEIEKSEKESAKRGSGSSLAVKKEGSGQLVLLGLPNSGKSTVLKALTNANVGIADYPFTTVKPEVGAMDFFGAQIQMVELPAIIEGSSEGKAQGTQLLAMARSADALVFVVDAAFAAEQWSVLKKECAAVNIRLNEHRPLLSIRSGEYKGLSVSGKQFLKIPLVQLESVLKAESIHNAAVVLQEPIVSVQQVRDALDESLVFKRSLVLVNGKRKPVPAGVLQGVPHFAFVSPSELSACKHTLFSLLGKVLVYTKRPGGEADLKEPLILPKGSCVSDLAKVVHKELAEKIRHARLYGKNAKFRGQKIPFDYELQNFDIIEIG